MRIAVLSDLHANAQALEAVMNDVVNQNCEHVFCLGDIALAGPQPKEVTDYVMAQNTWTIIQGNTDKMIAQYGPDVMEFLEAQYPVMANAIADDVLALDDSHRAFLENLPPQLSLDVVEEIIEGTTEKLILCGHTHIPCGYQTNTNQTVVNVGSVGRPMTPQPKACYAIIDFSQGSFEIRHRFVDYDNVLAAQLVSQRGFVGADRLADLLLNPVERHI